MTLKELKDNWKNYIWKWKHAGKIYRIVLEKHYNRCEIKEIRGSAAKGLLFHLSHDDGSWCHEFDILRCDRQGNCYLYTFYTNNINKYYWKKMGHFIKVK